MPFPIYAEAAHGCIFFEPCSQIFHELGGIEIEEPQESGEEIENADDVPIFKKRDSE